ncbi:lipoyl synthase [Rhodohalobacter sulfatireducens]|uniref:Lipoyl synthase n=1 Tax=Rhodohalobacter sulfatireducens TaxID=2911366 RepID=A0ABS9K840_9BACT|nr:lipoyl synthase [Rhodohalobacter sulfatireducens]MCG2587019.1 lipoyl synthase [Rhodohalobacter sulfatireducens]MDR9363946.1 lipoyl synthase [Balneolaceae bacterium]
MIKELDVIEKQGPGQRRPDWLRVKLPSGKKFKDVSKTIRDHDLNTVCSEARCPNMGECWGAGTATFMILGDVCTRSCSFCAVKTGRPPEDLDWDEPQRVANAAKKMQLKHVVLTSVNRDERKDGGAPIFAETHKVLREEIEGVTIESLIPDFRGVWDALQIVIDTPPDVLSHNLETVPRLYRNVRPQAKYERSLELLQRCKDQDLRTKTGIMVGLGETREEVIQLMQDCVDHNVDVLTIGQYMQPTKMHHPVVEWVHPDQFAEYKEIGETLGLEHVESGPLVRSSYHAERHV